MIKLGELVMNLDLHRQGLSVSAIARQLCVDRKTVRSAIARGWSRRNTNLGRRDRRSSIRSSLTFGTPDRAGTIQNRQSRSTAQDRRLWRIDPFGGVQLPQSRGLTPPTAGCYGVMSVLADINLVERLRP